ncbi:MAG: iron chelate uptake ABC transporter family permease subunit [Pirellulales bacterium]
MTSVRRRLAIALITIAVTCPSLAIAAPGAGPAAAEHRSITDRSVDWPTWHQWRRVLLLQDYNTRVVLLGTTLLGLAAGAVGNFTLLRKRALMGDALSHATLPGVGLAFVLVTLAGGDGKSLPLLLAGAAVTGMLGLAAILFIRNATRLKEDAALGIVLSVFFGAGVAVLGVAQQMKTGHAAGLEAFIYGKAASMGALDAELIGIAALIAAVVCVLLFKELRLLCFDEAFAGSRGYPVFVLDAVLMILVVMVTLIGLQAVGLILMVALLVVPAAAARFWTERMSTMAAISAAIGAASALVGAAMSALFPRLPSGAMIVLVATCAFLLSMFLGTERGVVVRTVRGRRLRKKIHRDHLLRALYEVLEARAAAEPVAGGEQAAPVTVAELASARSWNPGQLGRLIRFADARGLVRTDHEGRVRLTPEGYRAAVKVTYDHRLWELFLTHYADIAPSQVDRGADAIEHVLDADMIAELESLLPDHEQEKPVPPSLHPTQAAASPATN